MDPDELDAMLANDGIYPADNVRPLDNIELDAGAGRRARPAPRRVAAGPPDGIQYVGALEADAILTDGPPPPHEDEGFDTSCDELEDNDEYDIDDLFPDEQNPRERRPRGRLECFGCCFSSRTDSRNVDSQIDGQKMNNLIKIFSDGYGQQDDKTIARMCHLYFKHEIYLPLRARGVNVPMWRTKEIHTHFFEHQLDPKVFVTRQIGKYQKLSDVLHRTSFVRIPGGPPVMPSDKNLATILRVDAMLLKLYAQRPDTLNFHSTTCSIDFDAMGKLMGPFRGFSSA